MEKNKMLYLVALSGLFHDIGKFFQRAGGNQTDYKNTFKYQHAALSFKAIEEELKEGLSAVFTEEEINIIKDGTYHHNPDPNKPIQKILQKADHFSSSERLEEALSQEISHIDQFMQRNPRLRTVFENVSLSKNQNEKRFFYKLTKLSIKKEDIFPKDYYLISQQPSQQEREKNLGSYKSLWEDFKKEFNSTLKHFGSLGVKFSDYPEKVFEIIYNLLYKYTWCVPASTYDNTNKNNHYPDVSLFDHSRVLSAVASILYDYFGINRNIDNQEKSILHLKVDISGIQNFIYTVYKRPVAKILRGRSFFVALLPDVFSRYIVRNLGYTITNILYSGGGVFEIIVANTDENKRKLKDLLAKIEEYLLTEFEGEIGLSVGMYEYSPTDLSVGNYGQVLQKLNENLDNGKRRKFINTITKAVELINKRTSQLKQKQLCPTCRTYLTEEGNELCDTCQLFSNVGKNLPSTKYLIFATNHTQNFIDPERTISFGELGVVYLAEDTDQRFLKDKNITSILKINETESLQNSTGFKFLGITVPKAKVDLDDEEEPVAKGQILHFEYIAKLSQGDERIGILRMDVDNLGRIFSEGLKGKISISRISTLSRMMDLFFTGYLNTLCLEDTAEKNDISQKVNSMYYIVYAGGDDLFIIGPWNYLLEFAKKINQAFREYTATNTDITLSAGYVQTKPKYPIRISAELSARAEEVSKTSGKNRITAFKNTIQWERFKDALDKSEKLSELIKDKKISRGFIHYYKSLQERFLIQDKKPDVIIYKVKPDPMVYPYTQYYIARNVSDETAKKFLEQEFIINLEKNKDMSDFILNYSFLKTRN
ncbi:MAG: type III-A CRISPR-associated protein Cas10/Csm1 [Sulfurihydrogenibium sp.]